jgi:hypothetical protein
MHDPFGLFYVAVGDPAGAGAATEAICDALGAVTAQGTTLLCGSRWPVVFYPNTGVRILEL